MNQQERQISSESAGDNLTVAFIGAIRELTTSSKPPLEAAPVQQPMSAPVGKAWKNGSAGREPAKELTEAPPSQT
jgi:hypothetical protein